MVPMLYIPFKGSVYTYLLECTVFARLQTKHLLDVNLVPSSEIVPSDMLYVFRSCEMYYTFEMDCDCDPFLH